MPDGNQVQNRVVLEQVADAAAQEAIRQFTEVNPPHQDPLTAQVKWVLGILTVFITTAALGMAVWLVSTVSTMQVTLARIDERMQSQTAAQETRFAATENRVSRLEAAAEKTTR